MKLHYYPETDSHYIELKSTPGTEAREIVEGLVVDFDAKGEVVGFDIDHASKSLSRRWLSLRPAPRNETTCVLRAPNINVTCHCPA
jgi:uncharacterized protein YuzE